MAQLTLFDYLLLGIVGLSMVLAAFRGFAIELIQLAGVGFGFVLAALYYREASSPLSAFIPGDSLTHLAGFALVFCSTLIAAAITATVVDRLLKTLRLKWIDRVLGALFGFLRGGLIAVILVSALTAFSVRTDLVARSYLGEFLLTFGRGLMAATPNHFRQKFVDGYQKAYYLWVQETRRQNDIQE